MRVILKASLFQFVVCCVYQVGAVTVLSNPPANGSFVSTELEKTVSLTCLAPPGDEELQWFRNGALVNLKGNRTSQSSLCVQPVSRDDHGAIFTCQLSRNASVNAFVQLEVTYVPELSGTEEVFVEEQSDAVFSCDSRAHPPVKVTWMRDGKFLELSTGGYWTSNDGAVAKLYIPNLKREVHLGLYSCVADSSLYGTRTKSFNLTIGDRTMPFPLEPMIAGLVVVFLTAVLAVIARWKRITQCCK